MDIQNNAIVIDADTEALDSQITQISNDFAETYYLDNEQQEELEKLVAKAMKLGELYERKKWQAAKAQAVPEKTVKLHLVWNENKDECVGFLDSKDARYTATGDDRGMFGVTALGDYFRDLNDERNEFETQIVMIEVQEQSQ